MLCLVAVSITGAGRLSFDTDVLSLLPRDGHAIPAFRTFTAEFGSPDELYVVFTAPEGYAISDYGAEIDAWIERLNALDEVTRVDAGLADRSRRLEWLASRQLLLMQRDTLDEALRRLRREGMRGALAARRELLAFPSAEAADLVRRDPLGFYDLLRDQVGAGHTGVNLVAAGGAYVTPDQRSRLVIVHPARPPYDTKFSRALFAAIDRVRAAPHSQGDAFGDELLPPLRVELAGGHQIAVETESLIRRESISNTVVALALILPLLFLVFRSAWLVTVGALPAAIALLAVLGVLGLLGATLSAAATASAAMLFGLGVDGVVLLYVVHTLAVRDGEAGDPGLEYLRGPATSMLLGMWTTAATFYGLAVVDFPSLEQLGMLIGHSMALCGILTLLLVPALLPRRAPQNPPRSLSMPGLAASIQRHRSAIVLGAVVVTIALAAAALTLRVNPTLDRLRAATPGAAALSRLSQAFGLRQDVYVILQRGRDLETMLAFDERLGGRVAGALPSVRLQAASAILPSDDTQRRRADWISGANLSAAAVAADLEAAAREEGFKPDSFLPFLTRLPDLLMPTARLSYDLYVEHGLGDVIGRFVQKVGDDWLLASYVFPTREAEVSTLRQLIVDSRGSAVLTGLPLVNKELAQRFGPQFLQGLTVGTIVVFLLIVLAFRDWRLSTLALAPAAMGLIWAAGALAVARIELDLFAVFAVVTFIGIGVDYGIHLVHRYRDHGNATSATAELAPVILIAAAITLLGYGTLVMSSYPPLRSIGLVSIVSVVMLAVASVVVLPAMLAWLGPPPKTRRTARSR